MLARNVIRAQPVRSPTTQRRRYSVPVRSSCGQPPGNRARRLDAVLCLFAPDSTRPLEGAPPVGEGAAAGTEQAGGARRFRSTPHALPARPIADRLARPGRGQRVRARTVAVAFTRVGLLHRSHGRPRGESAGRPKHVGAGHRHPGGGHGDRSVRRSRSRCRGTLAQDPQWQSRRLGRRRRDTSALNRCKRASRSAYTPDHVRRVPLTRPAYCDHLPAGGCMPDAATWEAGPDTDVEIARQVLERADRPVRDRRRPAPLHPVVRASPGHPAVQHRDRRCLAGRGAPSGSWFPGARARASRSVAARLDASPRLARPPIRVSRRAAGTRSPPARGPRLRQHGRLAICRAALATVAAPK